MHRLAELPPSVRGYLGEFVARRRKLAALRAAGVGAAVFALWVMGACTLDRLFHLPSNARIWVLTVGAAAALMALLRSLKRLYMPVDWVEAADAIERCNPAFGQRLVTVTSRLLGEPQHRGSNEILAHLLREVDVEASAHRRQKLLSVRSAAGPWAAFFTAAAVVLALAQVPGVGTGALLHRFFVPRANVPPVTTTQLTVLPGDVDVVQSEPLKIEVNAKRLGRGPVWIYLNDDSPNCSRYTMDDAGGGRFTFTVTSVDRDMRYHVSGGDARSPRFLARVKSPPAVAQFRIRYSYPAYTGRAPFTVTNTDGLVEAPVGADAQLTVVATEPILSALLNVGGEKILMARAGADNVRQATLHVHRDCPYELDLISTREVHGGGPGGMSIHALVDHPPLVHLLQSGQSLRLNARDIVPLSYLAMDDYGLDALTVRSQVNAEPPTNFQLPVEGDSRRQEQTLNFDLASLKLGIGDVLTLRLVARDTAGQETPSEELHILVSPRSVDADAHERIDALNSSTQFAQGMADELDGAAKAFDEANAQKEHPTPTFATLSARGNRGLTGASEAAMLLRQSLLRVAAHSATPELAAALAQWVDIAQQEAFSADDLFRRSGAPQGLADAGRERLHHSAQRAREMHEQLLTVARGERASATLADRDNLKAAEKAPAPADSRAAERLKATLKRTREEIAAGAAEVGLNADAGDIDAQLKGRVDAADGVVRSRHPVDFVAAAREWAQHLEHAPRERTGLDARLSAAAQAQAVRRDADLVAARDLELASRAAGAIESSVAGSAKGKIVLGVGLMNGFIAALEALSHAHSLARSGKEGQPSQEERVAEAAADKAREQMYVWAAGDGTGKTAAAASSAAARQAEVEDLALRAGADAARRDYKHAAEADEALTHQLTAAVRNPGRAARAADADAGGAARLIDDKVQRIQRTHDQITRHMAAAQAVDTLGRTQEQISAETKGRPRSTGELAARQRKVAEQIAGVERQESAGTLGASARGSSSAAASKEDAGDPNWRGRATAALLLAQEQLAAMPQDLSAVADAVMSRRRAADRSHMARQDASTAQGDAKAMAERAAAQADHDLTDASALLDKILAPVDPKVAADLAERLAPFAPEASAARDIVAGPMLSSLAALQSAAAGNDAAAVSRASADVRQAIDSAQKELAKAQDAFTERDPLVAARWFARAAADALALGPADQQAASAHQAHTAFALSRAWDRSIHRASALRLSSLPSLQAVYGPRAPEGAASSATALTQTLPGAREWGKLHAGATDDLSATLRDPDPPGYEEPLRLYFQAIGKAQEKPK